MKAEIIKPEVAAKELREMGMRINAQNIRYGLREGKFPFGVAINGEAVGVPDLSKIV